MSITITTSAWDTILASIPVSGTGCWYLKAVACAMGGVFNLSIFKPAQKTTGLFS